MGDVIDRAQPVEEFLNKVALDNARQNFDKPSLSECEECGGGIEEKRQALGGVTKCVDCKTREERKGKLYAT